MENFWKDRQVLITGGAGFVGHHLAKRLQANGSRVRILDDLSTGRQENIPTGTEFIEGDIRDPETADGAVKGCDVVFHLAARVELQKSIVDPMDCFSVNVEGTACLVKASLKNKVRRFVFASSCSLYPLHPTKRLTEDMATIGETPYALSKRVGEQTIEIFSKLEGLKGCSLRCFNIYGPGQRADSPYAAAVPRFIAQAMKGEPITIFGEGSQTRDFIHVDDIVDAYLAAGESDAVGVFNAATGKATSVKELASAIQEIEKKSELTFLPAKSGDASSSEADVSLIRKILRFEPKRELKPALRDLYHYTKSRLANV